jgi:membrane associated rhomboid family serine protease
VKTKVRTKKDRLFIIVMAIIVANLAYILFQIIPYIVMGGYTNIGAWATAVANVTGIIGALWLIREERRRRRVDKAKED